MTASAPANMQCGFCAAALSAPDEVHNCMCATCGAPVRNWQLIERFAPSCAAHVDRSVGIPPRIARYPVLPYEPQGQRAKPAPFWQKAHTWRQGARR